MASTNHPSRRSVLKEVTTIGLDLAKTAVHFVGLDTSGQILTRRLYSKDKLLTVHRDHESLPHRHGGLLRRPSLGTPAARPGARRPAHAPQVREALCQARQVSGFTMHLFVIYGLETVFP